MNKFKKIYVEITNKCNLKCSFCSLDQNAKREMSLEEFELVLKKINNYTDYIYLHVKGEPLLHPNFRQILEICKKYHKQVNITTNGKILKNRLMDIIETNVVRQINISMQSLTNTSYLNDILRCSKYILDNSNIQLVFRFWALEDNKFTDLQIKVINSIIDFYNLNNTILEEILNNKNTKLLNNLYLNKDELFEWPNIKNNYYNELGHCYGLKSHIAILVDGTVVPCCLDSKGTIKLGNIFENSLEEILNNDISKNIIKSFQDNKAYASLCKHCSFKEKLKKGNY